MTDLSTEIDSEEIARLMALDPLELDKDEDVRAKLIPYFRNMRDRFNMGASQAGSAKKKPKKELSEADKKIADTVGLDDLLGDI